MILIIGGMFQGKKEYVRSRFGLEVKDMADGSVCSYEELFRCRGIFHFHEWIRRMLQENRDLTNLAGRLEKENPQIIIISNELGYGVVPVDSFDREYREAAGRICTRIARSAVSVHRVVCGIGTVIKDA